MLCKNCQTDLTGSKLIEGVSKTGPRAGSPYKAYRCSCGTMNFIKDNPRPRPESGYKGQGEANTGVLEAILKAVKALEGIEQALINMGPDPFREKDEPSAF